MAEKQSMIQSIRDYEILTIFDVLYLTFLSSGPGEAMPPSPLRKILAPKNFSQMNWKSVKKENYWRTKNHLQYKSFGCRHFQMIFLVSPPPGLLLKKKPFYHCHYFVNSVSPTYYPWNKNQNFLKQGKFANILVSCSSSWKCSSIYYSLWHFWNLWGYWF